ncbi:bifunctional aminoglycoside phosphotransferase/ATP-binding protein [Agrobacterium tumefaciens]|uniref:bifunctional aminoglycoside phosphotransferase/ATP-binding protein n=1 Tax=Agrobacterium tumefaciens TaxID=358 RepID=UPI0015742169|nr:bifunctional aminoglycoside phosphotransferase/ATP-binding protein [Agrobacterium tumefaciens]WCK68740.1 AAA family ATPase [Agrobacterium tumefaciens]
MNTEDQSSAIYFLSRQEKSEASKPVQRIETHISIIFLAGDKAFKMKKALKLPYVDFSTAAIREEACRKEVALNSETAPGLYKGIRRITRTKGGTLEFDGSGPLVETVVEMVRFDQERLFDRIATAGELTPVLMTATARMIAAYHHTAPVVSAGGGADNIAAVLDINDAAFVTSSHVFVPAEVASLGNRMRALLDHYAPLLDQRALEGRVRRCHGDLHLRNICLLDARPCLFDCIEFNAQIATIDVLYDLAFLLMDLWHRGFAVLANLVANRYLDDTRDEEGFALLPFFMAIRAAVRAHVIATQAEEPDQDVGLLSKEAKRYFELASALIEKTPPHFIAIGGLSGSGKSTVADILAPKLGAAPGARVIESDRIRKALYGVPAETRLPPAAYDAEVSRRVYQEMASRTRTILAQDSCVVADAVFARPEDRALIEACNRGTQFHGIWLDAPLSLLERRVDNRRGGSSDADYHVLALQVQADVGVISWHRIDASLSTNEIVDSIVKHISQSRKD